eukprot:m.67137 g.67137  ORF g.67137 m.67137 type:complete len:535 (+) comp11863_c0_seq1:68-1672(+)
MKLQYPIIITFLLTFLCYTRGNKIDPNNSCQSNNTQTGECNCLDYHITDKATCISAGKAAGASQSTHFTAGGVSYEATCSILFWQCFVPVSGHNSTWSCDPFNYWYCGDNPYTTKEKCNDFCSKDGPYFGGAIFKEEGCACTNPRPSTSNNCPQQASCSKTKKTSVVTTPKPTTTTKPLPTTIKGDVVPPNPTGAYTQPGDMPTGIKCVTYCIYDVDTCYDYCRLNSLPIIQFSYWNTEGIGCSCVSSGNWSYKGYVPPESFPANDFVCNSVVGASTGKCTMRKAKPEYQIPTCASRCITDYSSCESLCKTEGYAKASFVGAPNNNSVCSCRHTEADPQYAQCMGVTGCSTTTVAVKTTPIPPKHTTAVGAHSSKQISSDTPAPTTTPAITTNVASTQPVTAETPNTCAAHCVNSQASCTSYCSKGINAFYQQHNEDFSCSCQIGAQMFSCNGVIGAATSGCSSGGGGNGQPGSSTSKSISLSGGKLYGLIVGCLLLFAGCIAAGYFAKQRKKEEGGDSSYAMMSNTMYNDDYL